MEVLLAQPRGFCAGVSRAVDIVELALKLHGSPVYVYHEIVHNGHVVRQLSQRGAIFVDDLADVPQGAITIFSAHGVSRRIDEEARGRGLRVIDATCPLVSKVHQQVRRYARSGYSIVMIGHAGHDEVEGTVGTVEDPIQVVGTVADVAGVKVADPARVAYVTQTTLSPDDTREIIAALTKRFPALVGPDVGDICYATLNRQRAVSELARQVDVILVIGGRNSSNSNRLREVASQHSVPTFLIEDASQIDPDWIRGAARVGVTSGASAPEYLVTEVCERLRKLGASPPLQLAGVRETVSFRLPPLLRPTVG